MLLPLQQGTAKDNDDVRSIKQAHITGIHCKFERVWHRRLWLYVIVRVDMLRSLLGSCFGSCFCSKSIEAIYH